MKKFQPWNDTVRLLTGDWVLQPGRKSNALKGRHAREVEALLQRLSSRPAILSFTLILLALMVIL